MKRVTSVLGLLVALAGSGSAAQTPSRETGGSSGAEVMPPITAIALAAPNVSWRHERTAHADLYFPEGSYTPASRARHSKEAERAIDANLKFLRVRQTGARLHLFFVRSRNDMRQFVGGTPGGSAIEMEGDDVNEEEIVDQFKDFLDRVSAEDFAEAEELVEPDEEDDEP